MAIDSAPDASPPRVAGPAVRVGPLRPIIPPAASPIAAAIHDRENRRTERRSETAASLVGGESAHGFGTLLEPVLREACGGRLSEVTWFRADWQRGGALTGYATCRDDGHREHPVVVKLPVPPCERYWLARLEPFDHVTPRLYAHGEALGGYDLAWVVMERLPHGPLGPSWGGEAFDLLVAAVGRFYAASQQVARAGTPRTDDWSALLRKGRERAAARSLPDAHRWSACLKRAARRVNRWAARWEGRGVDGWCHGDLHLGNAMTRRPAPRGPAVLFDFAHTRVGHWLEDAVYLESQFWARPHRLEGRRLCRLVAQERRRLGLPLDADWPRLAEAKRALLAMTVPATLARDGDPQHVRAALAVLERAVG